MNSLAVSITDNLEERNVIIQNRQILNSGIIMIIGAVFYALVSEMVGLPIKWVVFGSSIIFFAMMVPMTKGVTEYNVELKNADEDDRARYTFKDMINCVRTNKYIFILLLSSVVTSCLATGGTLANFVAYYHFGNSMIFVIPVLISLVPGLIAQLSTAKLTKKFGKIPVILFTGLLGGIPLLAIYFVGTKQIVLICLLLVDEVSKLSLAPFVNILQSGVLLDECLKSLDNRLNCLLALLQGYDHYTLIVCCYCHFFAPPSGLNGGCCRKDLSHNATDIL